MTVKLLYLSPLRGFRQAVGTHALGRTSGEVISELVSHCEGGGGGGGGVRTMLWIPAPSPSLPIPQVSTGLLLSLGKEKV